MTSLIQTIHDLHSAGVELRVKDGALNYTPRNARIPPETREAAKEHRNAIVSLMTWASSDVNDFPSPFASASDWLDYIQRASDGLSAWENPGIEDDEKRNVAEYPKELGMARLRFEVARRGYELAVDREAAVGVAEEEMEATA